MLLFPVKNQHHSITLNSILINSVILIVVEIKSVKNTSMEKESTVIIDENKSLFATRTYGNQ